jgi:CRISPR-associated protein Cst2
VSGTVFEIGILARAVWDLHSLNNEGTVGNVTEPRTVVLADGSKSDGVSGEMLKHHHAFNVWLVANDKSIFCEPCQTLRPQRADALGTLSKEKEKEAAILDKVLKGCALCDLHGFLRTAEAIPRHSTVEFGWAAALPDSFQRDVHTHARHEVQGRTRGQGQPSQGEESAEAAAQMVYHRPTRSGTYAIVSVFAPWRIGLNEITYRYVEGVDRKARYRLALDAYKAMFARAEGAMTSTRLPHVEDIRGAVAVSTSNFPVPLPSPLSDSYIERLETMKEHCDGLEVYRFEGLDGLYRVLEQLRDRDLFRLSLGK